MKLIKEGNVLWWVGYKLTCNFCDAKLELEKDDKVTLDRSVKDSNIVGGIKCPTCARMIVFHKAKAPSNS